MLVGGGPLRPEVRPEAERRGIRVVQTYGMSETCGGCVYDGVPLDGVEVRIDADDQVLLRGPMLFDGYEGEPERTAAAFRDGWLVTNDLGHWAEDGRLRIDGRADDVIISGGVKVPAHGGRAGCSTRACRGRASRSSACPTRSGASGWSPWSRRLSADLARARPRPRRAAGVGAAPAGRRPAIPLLPNGKPDRERDAGSWPLDA